MFGFNEGIIALLIPILAVIGGVALAVISIMTKSREEELKHKERIIAMEKGIPIPEEPREEKPSKSMRHLTGGLVLTFLGLAFILLRFVAGNEGALTAGVIIIAIGLALLLAGWIGWRRS
jgi:hypothetical protein